MPVAFSGFASISDHWVTVVNLLFDFTLKGTAILLVAALFVAALRRASAATRHLVLSLSMVSLLALPVVYAILPEWQISILPSDLVQNPAESVERLDQDVTGPVLETSFEAPSPIFAEVTAETEPSPQEADQISPAVIARTGAADLGKGVDDRSISLNWRAIVVFVWLCGFGLVLLRLLVGAVGVWRLTRQAEPLTDALWTDLARRLSAALGLRPGVALLESERVAMPLTCGALRPAVLVPTDTAKWSLDRRRVVLTHELAHVKRRDCLTQMLANLACALYWFNPVVWLAARQLRIERERACDDCVLEAGTRPSDYAGHLLELARAFGDSGCSTFAAVAIARRSQLEGRVLAILDPDLSRRPNRTRSLFVALAIVCVAVPLGAVRLTARASDTTTRVESGQQQGATASIASPSAGKSSSEMLSAGPMPSHQPGEVDSDHFDDQPVAEDSSPQAEVEDSAPATEPEPASAPQEGTDRSRAIESLREALKDSDEQVRNHALSALAHMRGQLSVDVFKAAIKDQNPQVRAKAAWALGLNGDNSSVDSLIEALRDESGQVRAQAAWALGLQGDSRAIEPLIAALKDQEEHVRSQAAWALGLKGDRSAVEALAAALKDSSAQVRSQAAWALGLKGDRSAVDALGAALKDSSAQVRSQAAWALGLKGDKSVVDELIEALKDSSSEVRAQAAWALGMKGDRRASDALNAARKDDNSRVRQQASWALGMLLIRYGGGAADDKPDKPDKDDDDRAESAIRVLNDIRFEGKITTTSAVSVQGPLTITVQHKPVVQVAPRVIK